MDYIKIPNKVNCHIVAKHGFILKTMSMWYIESTF